METFHFGSTYHLISLNWALGYAADPVGFLRRCKAALASGRVTRASEPQAFILVLDTISETDEEQRELGQTIRSEAALEQLFKEAGLLLYKKKGPYDLHDFQSLMVWALY